MTDADKKLLEFGKMIFGMVTDLHLQGGTGYGRRRVTFPTLLDRTTKCSCEIIVTSDASLADLFENVVAGEYSVTDVEVSGEVQ